MAAVVADVGIKATRSRRTAKLGRIVALEG